MVATLGVLVAGGRGTRLALGVPKALARVAGVTLIERSLAVLGEVCDACVVAAPADLALPVDSSMRVTDVADSSGPLSGVVAGLAARPFQRAIVLGVDFPLIRPAMLEALLGRLGGRRAVVPAPAGIPQPLAAVYDDVAAALLSESLRRGERAVTRAVLALDPLLLDDAVLEALPGGVESFFNLNSRDDLEQAERELRAGAAKGRES